MKTSERYARVIVYGSLGYACIAALVAALAIPDRNDVSESQIATIYLTLLVGSNKAFNARCLFGRRSIGALSSFVATGLLPATVIYVALAQIEPGASAHLANLAGFGLVTTLTTISTLLLSFFFVKGWQTYDEKWKD